ncbi:hypothetical protein HI914_01169 [Erysiphe necator]|uniref:Putative ppe family protein n=1 Tax=Uncinula necator TaxID=52586 RepID=A0A0B1P7M4_UNCNE|nr:hypothetical protein HI914_01169 [Erysiphe necator]KHJ33310.1 putative ppe family protein [Erysiphe necator]
MHYIQILSFLACAQVAFANPILQQSRAKSAANDATQSVKAASNSTGNNITNDSVQRAADGFAQDAGIVSNAINAMTSMTDQNAIKATAQRAFDAESDEDNQRKVLAAAAGTAGNSANSKIQKYTPTVLNGLKAITKDPSPDSVQKNTQMMEDPRNANILPSITQLSNAALDAMGLAQTAPELKMTTGASGNGDSTNGGSGNNGGNSQKGSTNN